MSRINSNAATESSESRAQENNENPVIKNDEGKKVSSDDQASTLTAQTATLRRVIMTEPSSSVSLRTSRVRTRPLTPRQKRRLSSGAAASPRRPPLPPRRLKKREQRVRLPAEAGRGRLTPTPTRRQTRSTSRCQNSSSRMMKGQRDRLTCRGESGERKETSCPVSKSLNRPSDVNFFLFRWPFVSRESVKVIEWESGEETGRAVGTFALFLDSEGNTELELESSPEAINCGREDKERYPQGDTKSTRRGAPSGRQGESNSGDKAGGLAVSWFSP